MKGANCRHSPAVESDPPNRPHGEAGVVSHQSAATKSYEFAGSSFPDREAPDLQARIRGWLQARGKVETDPLPPSAPLPAGPSLEAGIAQVAAPSVPELLEKVDGRNVLVRGGAVALHTALATSEEDPDRVTWSFTDLDRCQPAGPAETCGSSRHGVWRIRRSFANGFLPRRRWPGQAVVPRHAPRRQVPGACAFSGVSNVFPSKGRFR